MIEGEAMDWLTLLRIDKKRDNYPAQLSGGEKQRVAIARAAILNPTILCFDEPTSALDPLLTNEVANLIQSLAKRMTILIVSHDIEFAKKVSDRIIVMKQGKIIADQSANSYFKDET